MPFHKAAQDLRFLPLGQNEVILGCNLRREGGRKEGRGGEEGREEKDGRWEEEGEVANQFAFSKREH